MVEVKAAKANKTKKARPNKYPPGIFGKTLGRVTKASPAPWVGSRLKVKTEVKIAIPAKMAIMVSKNAMEKADFTMLLSSLT